MSNGLRSGYEREADAFEADSLETDSFELSDESEFDQESERNCLLTKSRRWNWPLNFWKSRAKRNSTSFSAAFSKKVWRGVKKIGKPLGGLLKKVAKVASAHSGKAAGTFFGGPVGGGCRRETRLRRDETVRTRTRRDEPRRSGVRGCAAVCQARRRSPRKMPKICRRERRHQRQPSGRNQSRTASRRRVLRRKRGGGGGRTGTVYEQGNGDGPNRYDCLRSQPPMGAGSGVDTGNRFQLQLTHKKERTTCTTQIAHRSNIEASTRKPINMNSRMSSPTIDRRNRGRS